METTVLGDAPTLRSLTSASWCDPAGKTSGPTWVDPLLSFLFHVQSKLSYQFPERNKLDSSNNKSIPKMNRRKIEKNDERGTTESETPTLLKMWANWRERSQDTIEGRS